MTIKNARFWVWINDGPVKLTLRPEQELRWSQWHRTDEGWASVSESWRYDACDDHVHCCCESNGVDCDGRFAATYRSVCHVNNLHENDPYYSGIDDLDRELLRDVMWPAWEDAGRSPAAFPVLTAKE